MSLNDTLIKYASYWVIAGAISGSLFSTMNKINQIYNEPEPVYKNKTFELPMRSVYHTTRIASHSGMGAFIGGATALTAPISIPLYMYWRKDLDQEQK